MERCENVATVFRGKLPAVIEGHFHRSRMRLQQNVRHADSVAQGSLLARMTRILIAADVEPRPAIEGAFAHPGYKIGHEVVSEAVALVDRAPELAGPGLYRHSDTVAQTGRIQPLVLSLRREGEHKGTAGI